MKWNYHHGEGWVGRRKGFKLIVGQEKTYGKYSFAAYCGGTLIYDSSVEKNVFTEIKACSIAAEAWSDEKGKEMKKK